MKVLYFCFSLLLLGCTADPKKPGNQSQNMSLKPGTTVEVSRDNISSKKLPAHKKLEAYKGDTLSYIRENFKLRKSLYIGRPAKYLFADIELPVLKYIHNGGDPPRLDEVDGLYLKFESDAIWLKKMNAKKITNTLYLNFAKPMKNDHLYYLRRKYDGTWAQQIIDYYGTIVIDDIGLIDRGLKY